MTQPVLMFFLCKKKQKRTQCANLFLRYNVITCFVETFCIHLYSKNENSRGKEFYFDYYFVIAHYLSTKITCLSIRSFGSKHNNLTISCHGYNIG